MENVDVLNVKRFLLLQDNPTLVLCAPDEPLEPLVLTKMIMNNFNFECNEFTEADDYDYEWADKVLTFVKRSKG